MDVVNLVTLAIGGLVSGILAGFLGIGGGTVLVPLIVAIGYHPIQAVATSSLAILITSISGSVQNYRMGFLNLRQVLALGFPALITAQLGVLLAEFVPPYLLLLTFGLLILINVYLVALRQRLARQTDRNSQPTVNPLLARILTGGIAGFLAGFFGIGGGVIMVPLQMLLLGEAIKVAIQTSLGVIVLTAMAAAIGHGIAGNVLWLQGLILGMGGLLGVQFSTRFLPKLPDPVISLAFRTLLSILSLYIFWQAWQSYINAG